MNQTQVDRLMKEGTFSCECDHPHLIQTHISWVLLCKEFAFKIKKPLTYSFLDFSTLERRKLYVEKELALNRRITKDIYLGIEPITEFEHQFQMGTKKGELVDYALKMKRLDESLRLDRLLKDNGVTSGQMQDIARLLSVFHKNAQPVTIANPFLVGEQFNDLNNHLPFINKELGSFAAKVVENALGESNRFLDLNHCFLQSRVSQGFVRDIHGDLHSRNIFLYPDPVIFDCIEFSDQFRIIDILNEVAFLCMDLEAMHQINLSKAFLTSYLQFSNTRFEEEEQRLFLYFKAYRSNVRAKVNLLRAQGEDNQKRRREQLSVAERYLILLNEYMLSLSEADKNLYKK